MRLLLDASQILRAPETSPAERAVAIVALCEAVDQQLDLPANTGEILWAAITVAPEAAWRSLAASAVGRVAAQSLVSEILLGVTDASSGRAIRAAALDVLSKNNSAQFIPDHVLGEVGIMLTGTHHVRAVANLIMTVANTRKISEQVLNIIIERWSSSPDTNTRMAALDVLGVRGVASLEQIRKLLQDPAVRVRGTAAAVVGELLDPDQAAQVLAAALEIETSPKVRTVLNEEIVQLANAIVF